MTRSRNGGSPSKVAQWVLIAGLFMIVVSAPLAVLLSRAISHTAPTWLGIVPLPPIEQPFDLFPRLSEDGFDVTRWLWGLLADFLGVVFAVVYYLVLFTALLGSGFALGGGVGIADRREIARTIRRALGLRIIQILVGAYAMTGLALVFPATVQLALELLVTVSLWLVALLTLVTVWRYIESADHVLARIALWYPLTVALVVLPSVVVGIASPVVRPWFLTVSRLMASPVSETWLLTGLLPEFTTDYAIPITVAYGGFWVVVVLVIGWIVGVLTEVAAWLPPLLVHLAELLWGRVRRLRRGLFGDR